MPLLSVIFRKKPSWVFAGIYCSEHLPKAIKVYGTVKTEAVNKEYMELDERCSFHECKELVDFMVYRESRHD